MACLTIPSILITDDDVSFRDTVRQTLEPYGYRLSLAADGEEALSILQNDDVHLLLLDMHMPRLTGLQIVERARRFKAPLPWILMSARVDENLLEQARLAQAFTVLNKPPSRIAITRNVELALRQSYNWSPPKEPRIDLR
jgi:two-component system chemotaxis response regulator CheY